MRCYFMRGGHIEAVEELGRLPVGEAIAKLMHCFQSASFFSRASSCGTASACLSATPKPVAPNNVAVCPLHRGLRRATP